MLTNKYALALLLAGCGLASTANAATVCVNTAGELVSAITAYHDQPTGTLYNIKLVRGTYLVGPGLNTSGYNNPATSVGIQILGGYNSDCTQRTINPLNTIIDAQDNDHTGLYFIINGPQNGTVEGVTLQNFNSSGLSLLKLYHAGEDTGSQNITVRHVILRDNVAVNGIYIQGEMSRAQNNLVANNNFSGAAIYLNAVEGDSDTNPNITITNNTVTNNTAVGVRMRMAQSEITVRTSELTNNIIWGNGSTDIVDEVEWFGNGALTSNGNIFGTRSGSSGSSTDLIANPGFVNSAGRDYRITTTSPAYNSGYAYQALGYPALDLNGSARVVGSKIDRGAYENTTNNNTTFIVTTTSDNGNNTSPTSGSLRAAIKAANAASGDYTIRFNINTTCPAMINLPAPLPDIANNVTIDGTTQPGWQGNSEFGKFDATLCVYLYANGQTHALRAAVESDYSVIVKGIIFQGYADAAIVLSGGTNHQIYGNQFGAIFGASNSNAILLNGGSDNVQIGNSGDPANSNLFAGSSSTGIKIDGATGYNTVSGNLIGVGADGTSNAGNGTGVYIYNSPYNTISDNVIGHNTHEGVSIAGSLATRNVVSENHIGDSIVDPATPVGNGGPGVSLTWGAINNTIGANANSMLGGNIIKNNGSAGVKVGYFFSSYATGSRILGNTINDNAGLAIDLGDTGATANVATNPIDAPNHGQNYPVLTAATWTSDTSFFDVVHFAGTLHGAPAEDYRIDFYLGPACSGFADGRGRAGRYLGYVTGVHTDSNGNVGIDTSVLTGGVYAGGVSMAATRVLTGDTSELGNCMMISAPVTTPEIFANGFE